MRYKNRIQICLYVIKQGKAASILFLLLKMLSGVMLPLTAFSYQQLIDKVMYSYHTGNGIHSFFVPLILLIFIYIYQALEEPLSSYHEFLMRQRINYKYDTFILNKLEMVEYCHLENSEDLDLLNRVKEASGNPAVDLLCQLVQLLSGIIKIVGVLFLLISYSIFLAFAVVIVATPIFVLSAKHGKAIHDWYQVNAKDRRYLGYLTSIFTDRTAAPEIKEYNYYSYLKGKWQHHYQNLRKKDFNLQLKAWKNTLVSSFLLNIFEYSTYLFLLIPTFRGVVSVGSFVGLSKAISSIQGIILWNFSSILTFLSNNKEYWNCFNCFLDFSEIQRVDDVKPTPYLSPKIEFCDVYFRYDNMKQDVLSGVSFCIHSGELCGLVGINGAGKSTLTKLLLGLYKPDRGNIFINGKNTKAMSFVEQASYFGVTYQDFTRYQLSIKDNIRMSNYCCDNQDKIEQYLNELQFDYLKLPQHTDTLLGRTFGDGIELSGGEWNKIAIARMLYSDAPFYIMDEPTASLDPFSEVILYQQLQSVLMKKTALFITHRLAATTFCSKILVLADGKIVENGTFHELVERQGIYADLYEQQKKWYSK